MMTVEEINEVPIKLGAEDWIFCCYKVFDALFLDDMVICRKMLRKFSKFNKLKKKQF